MIHPPGLQRVLFGESTEGDPRRDPAAISPFRIAGSPPDVAFPHQVHGGDVLTATGPGPAGDADALITMTTGMAVAVATADCVPVAIVGPGFAAVVHAGWRGAAAGVVETTIAAIARSGLTPDRAAVGPAIGPCCYEVGPEVLEQFPDHTATTTWGTPSIDLPAAVADSLGDIPVWRSDRCTYTDDLLHSHRRDGTTRRQVSVAWAAEPG